jgi:hypothetical protein
MFTPVTRDQFEVREGVFVHTPTQAEFTPHPNHIDSLLVWTGNIVTRLPSGDLFDYAEVLAMMRMVQREMFRANSRLELTVA